MQKTSPASLSPTQDGKTMARGRGAPTNPTGRFEPMLVQYDEASEEDVEPRRIKTEIFKDASRTVVSFNDSPDVYMSATLNPYRGCEHGCIYCYARPTHEYLGLSAGVDFESKLFVKHDAPALLREKLGSKAWVPQVITMSGITDCYQPIERTLKITRGCLEVLAEFRNPVTIITKNHLVTRDIDVLSELAKYNAAQVFVSITTLNGDLARALEPRASQPRMRLDAVRKLNEAGVPAGIMMAPIIPGLTDHEIPSLLKQAAEAGAIGAGRTVVRLPYGVKELFQQWLETHAPLRKDKILNRIRSMRDGKLNDPNFGTRMSGKGLFADAIHALFDSARRKYGLDKPNTPLSTAHFRNASAKQMSLF